MCGWVVVVNLVATLFASQRCCLDRLLLHLAIHGDI